MSEIEKNINKVEPNWLSIIPSVIIAFLTLGYVHERLTWIDFCFIFLLYLLVLFPNAIGNLFEGVLLFIWQFLKSIFINLVNTFKFYFNLGEVYDFDKKIVIRARVHILLLFAGLFMYYIIKIWDTIDKTLVDCFTKAIQHIGFCIVGVLFLSLTIIGIIIFICRYIKEISENIKKTKSEVQITGITPFEKISIFIKEKFQAVDNFLLAPILNHENLSLVITAMLIYGIIPCSVVSYAYECFIRSDFSLLSFLKINVVLISLVLAIYSMIFTTLARKESVDAFQNLGEDRSAENNKYFKGEKQLNQEQTQETYN